MTASINDPGEALQVAVVEVLVADPGVSGEVYATSSGPAVFAPGDDWADVYPRVTIETPQVLPRDAGCGERSECFVVLHSWARGTEATLVAGRLAGLIRDAMLTPLSVEGHVVSGQYFAGSRPVGDPANDVAHIVSEFRVLTRPDL
jgi:hypothetical protein